MTNNAAIPAHSVTSAVECWKQPVVNAIQFTLQHFNHLIVLKLMFTDEDTPQDKLVCSNEIPKQMFSSILITRIKHLSFSIILITSTTTSQRMCELSVVVT